MKFGLAMGINARAENLETMGGFEPSDISNLDIHYDFSKLSGSNGDAVAAATNLGGGGSNYNLAQGTGANQPTLNTSELSLNSVDFTSNDFLELASDYTTTGETFSIFVVYEVDATGDSDTFIAGSSSAINQFGVFNNKNVTTKFNGNEGAATINGAEFIRTDQTTQDAGYTGDATSTTAYTLTADPEILVLTRDASSDKEIRIYNKNGALVGLSSSPSGAASDTNFHIGQIGLLPTGGTPADGVIGEMGIYNKTLSASEVSSLVTYLADKWSIS